MLIPKTPPLWPEPQAVTIWHATIGLRIVRERRWISDERSVQEDTLQQRWITSEGEEEWRNVEIVEP